MPLLGWLAETPLESIVIAVAPVIAFISLALIGANMIRESLSEKEESSEEDKFSFKEIATSIDAYAVGVIYTVLKAPILIP